MVPRYVTRVAVPSPSGQQLTCITGKYDIHVSCRHQCTATEPRATRISVLIPHHARMRMVFGSITKNVDNPDAWVQACLRIYDCCQRTPLLPELSRASASSCASSLPDPDLGTSNCGGFPQGAPGLVAGALGSHGRDRKFRHHGTYHFCSWANVPSYPRPRPLAVFMIFSIMGVFEEEVMATHISCHGVAQEPWSRGRSMRINVAQPHPELGVQVLRVGALRGQVLRLRVLRIRVLRVRVHGRNYRFSVQIILAVMPSIMVGTIVSVCSQAIPSLHRDISVELMPIIFL